MHRKALLPLILITMLIMTPVIMAVADTVQKAFLGVVLKDLDKDNREALEYKGKYGVLVEEVVPESPAESAGISSGDIIIEIDGKKVKSFSDVTKILNRKKPEDVVKIQIHRNGKSESLSAVLASKQPIDMAMFNKVISSNEKRGFLGVSTRTLDGQLADYFGVKNGALVKSVEEGSPAETVGIKAGDVIVAVNEDSVDGTMTLANLIRQNDPGTSATINIIREKNELTVTVELGETTAFAPKGDKRIIRTKIIHDGEEVDWNAIKEAVKQALEDINIDFQSSDFKGEIEKLRKEMKELKKEIKVELEKIKKKDQVN